MSATTDDAAATERVLRRALHILLARMTGGYYELAVIERTLPNPERFWIATATPPLCAPCVGPSRVEALGALTALAMAQIEDHGPLDDPTPAVARDLLATHGVAVPERPVREQLTQHLLGRTDMTSRAASAESALAAVARTAHTCGLRRVEGPCARRIAREALWMKSDCPE